jgi:nicotinamidase-related amidase
MPIKIFLMKKLLFFLFIMTTSLVLKSQVPDSTALILIDIQNFYFPGGSVPLVQPETAAQKAATLLTWFRDNNKLVVHIGHLAKTGTDFAKLVTPLAGEKVIMKKEVNAFLHTDLDQYLRENHIRNLILCGMQTHMCLEGATRAAHDLGYQCTVAGDACATRDLTWEGTTVKAADVHAATLATLKSYAKVSTVNEIVSGIRTKGK